MLIAETSAFDPSQANQNTFKNTWISQVYNEANLRGNLSNLHAICYFHVAKIETIATVSNTYTSIMAAYRIPLETNTYKQLIGSSYFLSEESDMVVTPTNFLLLKK